MLSWDPSRRKAAPTVRSSDSRRSRDERDCAERDAWLNDEMNTLRWTDATTDDGAVLLALMNGFVIMLLSMLGEYVVRTLNAVSAVTTYHVARRVSS